jgi:hypothetical protein
MAVRYLGMSLAIDVDKVTGVLLADGWHEVVEKSFMLDSYEFLWWPEGEQQGKEPQIAHGGGDSGVCATGFQFAEYGVITTRRATGGTSSRTGTMRISGPLTAILAVRT